MSKFAFDQADCAIELGPDPAGNRALGQAGLDLQGAESVQIKGQFQVPEDFSLLFPVFLSLLLLDAHLYRHQRALLTQRDLHLPGIQQGAVRQRFALRQAAQLVSLQARQGGAGELEQRFQAAVVTWVEDQTAGQGESAILRTGAGHAEYASGQGGQRGRSAAAGRGGTGSSQCRQQLRNQSQQIGLEVALSGEPLQ
ncbi:hypothetical protein D9M71_626070 [compost metagenome]